MPDHRTPFTVADERTTLLDFLAYLRTCVAAKAEGLSESDARRRLVPSGTSVLGLVKHLTMVEVMWVQRRTAGLQVALPDERIDEADTVTSALKAYLAAGARTDEILRALPDLGQPLAQLDDRHPLTARWVLVHLVEETARHAGHVDIVRELIDGTVGR